MGDLDVPKDAPRPRLCHLVKREDFWGYGFNLHAERNKVGQYVGKIDDGSPAALSGMKEHDRIVEVNGVNIGNENHKQVVERIKTNPNEAQLLVVDRNTDNFYKERNIVIKGTLPTVLYLKTPTLEEEANLNESLEKHVTIVEHGQVKDRGGNDDYDPYYATIATPSPPPPPEESAPPSPPESEALPPFHEEAPPTPPPAEEDVPACGRKASNTFNQELEIQIPRDGPNDDDPVTPPPPYDSYINSANGATPEPSPLTTSSEASASPNPASNLRTSPGAVRSSNSINSGSSSSNNNNNVGESSVAGDPHFGLSVADMRARLNARKKTDVKGKGNYQEKYDIFQKL